MKILTAVLAGCAALALGFLVSGCETDPANEADIVVTPPSATVAFGQSVEFVASGWFAYTWSLQYPQLGVLSRHVGDSTVYTSIVRTNNVGTNTVQILHCQGVARTSVSGTDTNVQATAAAAPSADVYITLK